jgi:hypothetical protein
LNHTWILTFPLFLKLIDKLLLIIYKSGLFRWGMFKLLNKLAIAILSIFLIFLSTPSFALTKGFQAISLYPATDGGPYIGIWGRENLNQLEWKLELLGIDPSRVTTVGKGSADPIEGNAIAAGRAANRRVEFETGR